MKSHSSEHIETRLDEIQLILEATYDTDDGKILSDRITLISTLMAESGKLLGDSQFHYHSKLNSEIMKALKELFPEYTAANVQNQFVKSLCKEELRLVTLADRINASCTHSLDAMRSQLSYLKSLPNY